MLEFNTNPKGELASHPEQTPMQNDIKDLLHFLEEANLHLTRYVADGVKHRVCTYCGADNEPHEDYCLIGQADGWLQRYKEYSLKSIPKSRRRRLGMEP